MRTEPYAAFLDRLLALAANIRSYCKCSPHIPIIQSFLKQKQTHVVLIHGHKYCAFLLAKPIKVYGKPPFRPNVSMLHLDPEFLGFFKKKTRFSFTDFEETKSIKKSSKFSIHIADNQKNF